MTLGLRPLAYTENDRLGSKHWPKQKWDKLWTWTLDRIDQIFVQIKPDTLSFWKSVFSVSALASP
jgi:proteasome activator subunit 4